jgi:hypothetical protein
MAEGQDKENEEPDGAHMGKMTRRKASETILWWHSILQAVQKTFHRSTIIHGGVGPLKIRK